MININSNAKSVEALKDLNNTEYKGKVISEGEATGKYKLCYNIEYQSPLTLSLRKHGLTKIIFMILNCLIM